MNEDQIWEQLELRARTVCEALEFILEESEGEDSSDDGKAGLQLSKARQIEGMVGLDEDGMEEDADGDDLAFGESGEDEDDEDEDEDEDENEDEDDEDEDDDDDDEDAENIEGEHITELRDPSESEDDDMDLDKPSLLSDSKRPSKRKSRTRGHPELDDGFFDLAAFNAETEAAEAQSVTKGKLSGDEDDDEAEDDDPIDYFAPVDDDASALDESVEEQGGMSDSLSPITSYSNSPSQNFFIKTSLNLLHVLLDQSQSRIFRSLSVGKCDSMKKCE